MTNTTSDLSRIDPAAISNQLQAAGICGAGGAGFPSYVKWENMDSVSHLMINHQESEPNYYADKWLGREYASELRALVQALLDTAFDTVVIGTKEKYRDEWNRPLEAALDAAIHSPTDLPVDLAEESGSIIAYTPNVYTYSEEKVLLMVTTGLQIGDDLPTEHGWIVHNTETIFNIYRALCDGTPVTRKFVHVDGNTPKHRCLDVPIGTPATVLLEAAGVSDGEIDSDQVLVDGGPGWCYEITQSPAKFGVRKRTNGVLVLDERVVREHTMEDGQINVLDAYDWDREHETEPVKLEPECVRIPLLTNEAYSGFVQSSNPVVEAGDAVSVGDVIATPRSGGISTTQHASIDGTIEEITDDQIVICGP